MVLSFKTFLMLLVLLMMMVVNSNSFSFPFPSPSTCQSNSNKRQHSTQIALFNFGGASTSSGSRKATATIPSSMNDRDNKAISAVKAAIQKPRFSQNPLIECEFPALAALNKLGDGSLRSTLEAEDANIAFVSKLVKGLSAPAIPFLGGGGGSKNIVCVISSSASNSFLKKAQTKIKGATVVSLKDGVPAEKVSTAEDICIFLTPSSRNDYQAAKSLADSGGGATKRKAKAKAVVVVNAFAKDQKSIGDTATMAFFMKPLTYNSQVAGFLIRSYPSLWTVLDAETKEVLGSFTDDDILVRNTNTPDLRSSGKLVQRSVDNRAIQARANM